MKVREVTPGPDCGALLAGAQFADAYSVAVADPALDARQAAERMFARNPPWLEALLRLRNILVTPFGLKTSGENEPSNGGVIGLFPVLSETSDRLVAGFDDRHLDFRVVVDVARGEQVTATTVVKTHNLLGRVYLGVVLPFHRLIVRNMLQRAFLQPAH
jgi:uncharacterized protein DUF2867